MKGFKDQPILSTARDSQGETRTKEFLEDVVKRMPPRFPLGQHHDMVSPYCGHMENFRVVSASDAEEEWLIIADIYLESGKISDAVGGFSYSFTAPHRNNGADPEASIFLPFPYYNDETLIDELLNSDAPLAVGKWHKKSADAGTIALIVSFIFFALGPAWQKLYDSRVHPVLVGVIRKLKESAAAGLQYHYGFVVKDTAGRPANVYMIPAPQEALHLSQVAAFKRGLEVAMDFIQTDPKAKSLGLYLLKMRYNADTHEFAIFSAQFRDGSVQSY